MRHDAEIEFPKFTVIAIDTPGSVVWRLDMLKTAALLLLFLAGTVATSGFNAALSEGFGSDATMKERGFTPLLAAIPFMVIMLSGVSVLVAVRDREQARQNMAGSRRNSHWNGAIFECRDGAKAKGMPFAFSIFVFDN